MTENALVSGVGTVVQEVKRQLSEEASKPLKVSIMGQTGVGKSSLLNALFGTSLETSSVRPCTKEIQQVPVSNQSGNQLWFYDLPGIGESEEADQRYLEQYREKLLESDVLLWAIHADNRSISFDLKALQQILSDFGEEQQAALMRKITFVLTKVDILSPPWILGKIEKKTNLNIPPWTHDAKRIYGIFAPTNKTKALLAQKASYYQEIFLKEYGKLMSSQTHNDVGFDVESDGFAWDQYTVRYDGFLDEEKLKELKNEYPKFSDIFDRLYDNYQVIPCSSYFRFNLNQLMLVTINKLGEGAIQRFKNFFSQEELAQISFSTAKSYSNIIVVDEAQQ